MGAFVLLRREQTGISPGRARAVSNCLEKQGFRALITFETEHWVVLAAGKYAGTGPAVYVRDKDNFVICSGTMLYKGTTGTNAARMFFDEFDEGSIPWDLMYGSFCVVMCCGGQLRLVRDCLGTYKLYRDNDWKIVSSSFLAVLETVGRAVANKQSIYEYVFQGATYDDRTVVDEIRLVERQSILQLGREIRIRKLHNDLWDGTRWSNFDEHMALCLDALNKQFRAIVDCFGNNIETALSGGYDSRLLLALLHQQDASARVHVYGNERDPDVTVAKSIARAEGFTISHIDKSKGSLPSLEEFPTLVSRNFLLFDGYPSDGIFDSGIDANTRAQRAAGGALALNGGGGEIFRNFFYLRDRSFSVRQVLWAFFSQFDPLICTSAFDETEYLGNLARAIGHLLELSTSSEQPEKVRLSRKQVEYLYPCFRCVYWMGRNNSVNNRFGYFATPFIEPAHIKLALQIPLKFKNHGLFEADLIAAADPALAKYPSVYGHRFDETPSFKRLCKDYLTLLRTPYMRKNSYRIQNRIRRRDVDLHALSGSYVSSVLDASLPEMRRYFNVGKIANRPEFNRICTLEYLFERYPVSH